MSRPVSAALAACISVHLVVLVKFLHGIALHINAMVVLLLCTGDNHRYWLQSDI